MGSETLYQISLLAAFVAGMVALFAPCCISYLLPAYFGNIFKEKKHILFMTFVYSLGIFVVMMPVVLGAKALSMLFFSLHDQTYIAGGIFMIVVSFIALLGIKLPMPHFTHQKKDSNDIASTFTLGIFSGITSSCCAPVLVGVITLSTLTPTIIQSLGVGLSYVFGMVAPLYLASALIDRRNILEKPFFRRQLANLKIGKKKYPIFVSNLVAAIIFFITGLLTIILSATGMLGMPTAHSPIVETINNTAFRVTEITKGIPGINLIFTLIGAYLLYRLIKKISKST